ncbi:hypothetical protein PSM_A2762 [Pseudoalteromonas sp. SM9913]|nr:hypothetical protein PSM_A2762 [Pseudoalteromonas sp. SM9913]
MYFYQRTDFFINFIEYIAINTVESTIKVLWDFIIKIFIL